MFHCVRFDRPDFPITSVTSVTTFLFRRKGVDKGLPGVWIPFFDDGGTSVRQVKSQEFQ